MVDSRQNPNTDLVFGILGPLEVYCEGAVLELRGPRRRALLALLLVNPNEVVSDGVLLDELWGARPPASGGTALRVRVSQLRSALPPAGPGGPTLARQADGYALRVDPLLIDARRFERSLSQGSEALRLGVNDRAAKALREGLDLWRGSALDEFADQSPVRLEAARLAELHASAREDLAEAELALGRHVALVPELEALIAAEPLRERPRGLLMLALYRSGRQVDALAAYQNARKMLGDQLGLAPSRTLRELEGAMLRQDLELEARPSDAADARLPVAGVASREDTDRSAALPTGFPLPPALGAKAGAGFVGRDRELTRLCTLSEAGSLRLIAVAGEAGIGKTRLVAEMADRARANGSRVLYGRCQDGPAPTYVPFVEALSTWVETVEPVALAEALGHHAADLARVFPGFGTWLEPATKVEPTGSDPESLRYALFEAVAVALAAAAGTERLLLILDDLHWASPPTLLALRHLLRSPRAPGVTVVATYRPEGAHGDAPLGDLLAAAARDPGSEEILLTGLGASAVAAIARPITEHLGEEHARQMSRELVLGTGGNPFYVREVVAHLLETGVSAEPQATHTELPAGLRRVIGHRIDRLSPNARRTLAAASVAGPEFTYVVVERVLGEAAAGDTVLTALEEIVAAGLLAETPEGRYAFVHALVLQSVYGDLGAARRQRLHRRVGEAMEAQGDAAGQIEALAHHFAQSAADGQAAKAAAYALAAGATAMADLGYEEAASHCRRGLDSLEGEPGRHDEVRCELLLGLGEARWSTGEMEAARGAFLEAGDVADRLGDTDRLARAALGFCGPPRFEPEQAYAESVTRLLERALAAPGSESGAYYARLTARLAAALTYPGPTARRTKLARTALVAARAGGDTAGLAYVLSNTYFATRGPDNLHARLHTLNELGRLADDLEDGRLLSLVRYWRSLDLLELGKPGGMQQELEALEQLAETLGERYPRWLVGASRARNAQLLGELERCEQLAQEAVDLGDEVGEAAMQVFGGQLVWVRREQGRIGELIEGVEMVVAQYPELTAWRCGLALFYAESGRPDEAHRTLDTLAEHDFADIQRDVLWTLALTLLTDVTARLDERPRATPLYELLAPFEDRCVVAESAVCLGSAARPLGVLATLLDRFDAAEAHFERALERNEALGTMLWTARTRHDWATMLRCRAADGDAERAAALDGRALADAERLGLVALAGEIAADGVPA